MMSLVIHLVMQSDVGADKALDFLLYNATVTAGKYQQITNQATVFVLYLYKG